MDISNLIPQLRGTLGKMEVALGAITDAIVWTDQRGLIQWCNRAFDQLIGRRHLQVLGAKLIEVLPLERVGVPLPLDQHPVMLALTTKGQPTTDLYEFRVGNQTRVLEIFRTTVMLGSDVSAILAIHDITDQKRAEEGFREKFREMEQLNKSMLNREERVLELKQEIAQLREEVERLRKALPPKS